MATFKDTVSGFGIRAIQTIQSSPLLNAESAYSIPAKCLSRHCWKTASDYHTSSLCVSHDSQTLMNIKGTQWAEMNMGVGSTQIWLPELIVEYLRTIYCRDHFVQAQQKQMLPLNMKALITQS